MGRREARQVEQRIHLDTLVRLEKFGGAPDPVTGNPSEVVADEIVWAAIDRGRSEFNIGAQSTTLEFSASVTIRYNPSFVTLSGGRIKLYNPPESTDNLLVTNVEIVGRRRFSRLEYV